MLLPHAKLENGLYVNFGDILSITGVAIFALGCLSCWCQNFADVLAFAGNTGDLIAFILLPILIWVVRKGEIGATPL